MKIRYLLAALASILLFVQWAPVQQNEPSSQQQQTKPAKPSKTDKSKPRRQRVVTDLSGFDLLEAKTVKRQATIVGATRGLPRPVALAPRLGKLYGHQPVFAWSYEGKAQSFVFVLWNDVNEEVFRSEVKGTTFKYPPTAPALEPGKTYLWTVEAASALLGSSTSAPVGFLVVSAEQRPEIDRSLPRSATDSYALGLQRARVFTGQRLWYDALTAYTELIARYPDRLELYEERGTIYAQLETTKALADADFDTADQLRQGTKPQP